MATRIEQTFREQFESEDGRVKYWIIGEETVVLTRGGEKRTDRRYRTEDGVPCKFISATEFLIPLLGVSVFAVARRKD